MITRARAPFRRRVRPTPEELGLVSCDTCGLVSPLEAEVATPRCARCGSALHHRNPNCISHCWALVIAAYITYIPANLMVIMETSSIISHRKDTIMSGVIHLWKTGFYGIAAIVFVASILVPLFKLIALSLLLISVQRRSVARPMGRVRLYRVVELVGRWSMLDIFVVTLMAAIVQISSLATVRAGNGAIAFGAVVVLTMFASMKFDPRLIWDPVRRESDHDNHATTD